MKRLALVAVAALAVAVPATAAPAKFTPAVLAGTWAGTWDNLTFNTKGTLTLTVTSAGNALGFSAAITGNTFGCAAPGAQTFKLPAGTGANHWTSQGFTITN